MPFSLSSATVITGVERGRSRASSGGRLRSEVQRPVSSSPLPEGWKTAADTSASWASSCAARHSVTQVTAHFGAA
jgi:hypothetical protein